MWLQDPRNKLVQFLTCLLPSSSGFCQYGLFHDDCLHEYDDVKEALARLPQVSSSWSLGSWLYRHHGTLDRDRDHQELLDERAFRIQRALNCSNLKTVLPKDQWTTYEEDRERGRSEHGADIDWRLEGIGNLCNKSVWLSRVSWCLAGTWLPSWRRWGWRTLRRRTGDRLR